MQGTVVLGTGEPSPIMKRSPSARLDKKEAFTNGDKLFQSFDGAIGRTRRNSIPSPFGLRNETGRGSVPLLLGVPGYRPTSGTTRSSLSNLNGSKRSWKSYLMKGLGDQTGGSGGGGGNSDLSKLDDKLATIKHQLGDMSIETRNFGARVTSLVQDITTLSQTIPRPCSAYGNNNSTNSSHDKILTLPQNIPQRAETTTSSAGRPQYNTLPLVLPMIRAHSQPTHLLDEWRIEFKSTSQGEEGSDQEEEESAGDVSQDSQEDFEVKVIHSSLLDNHHHMIVVSSPCPSNDLQSSSEENLHDMFGNAKAEVVRPATQFPLLTDMEDVFDI